MRRPPLGGRRPTGAEAGGREGFLEKLSQNESYGQWEVAWQKTQAPGVTGEAGEGRGRRGGLELYWGALEGFEVGGDLTRRMLWEGPSGWGVVCVCVCVCVAGWR